MRRILLFIAFVTQTVLAQTYKFTKLTTYAANFENYKGEKTVFSNLEEQGHFLWLKNDGSKTIAVLADLKSMEAHYFLASSSGNSGDVTLDFEYIGSEEINKSQTETRNHWTMEPVSETDSTTTKQLTIYKNQRATKVPSKAILQIRKQQESQFALFRVSCLHLSEFELEKDYDIGGIVTSAKFEGKSAGTFHLVTEQSVALKISVPEKRIAVTKNQFGSISIR